MSGGGGSLTMIKGLGLLVLKGGGNGRGSIFSQ